MLGSKSKDFQTDVIDGCSCCPQVIFLRKYSMKVHGVEDCIFHFNVLSTNSSICRMALASNGGLDSPTYKKYQNQGRKLDENIHNKKFI